MTLLRVDNVTKMFGGVRALHEVSFEAGAGEIVGIIGPNGSGKTTLVNTCTGVFSPTSGTLSVGGEPVTRRAPARMTELSKRGITRTFQHPVVFDGLTVLENVLVGAESTLRADGVFSLVGLPGGRRAHRRARELAEACVEEVGLEQFMHRQGNLLSPGLQHFLEIARALATQPRLVFLDEPAAGLNERETDQLSAVLRAVAARGVGLAVIEHDVRFVLDLSARVVVLNFGQLIAEGLPDTIASDRLVLDAYLGTSGRSGIGIAED
ncbi:ABC transporter ATP-binding protein [Nocardioides terrisoli]|uniref:ABC transporter ATP-binding protein n=1 Tax=Nocardioides terrisoli TaxID=3388267 RepID=UPI00287B7043|nr:ABC transporter ATP-binding protein [Nocardioides marmorisolisilvae]